MRLTRINILPALALVLALPASALGAWKQPVGGDQPINRAASDPAANPSLTAVGGVPWVAWVERHDNEEVRAARLTAAGTAWDRSPDTASPINESASGDAELPSITAHQGEPCVAWDEFDGTNTEVRVACLQNGEWAKVANSASPINHSPTTDASHSSLVSFNGVLYVAWSELDGGNVSQIRVARQNGNVWDEVPDVASPINRTATHPAHNPSLAVVGGDLYVAWNENDGASNKIRVSRFNGTTWDLVADTVGGLNENPTTNAADPSLADIGGVPHVAWSEIDGNGHTQIRVAKLNGAGTQWLKVGQIDNPPSPINENFNQNAEHPSLTAIGSPAVPYVTWTETDADGISQVRVARLNAGETGWEKVADAPSPINNSAEENSAGASIASVGGIPWVAWAEQDPDSTQQNPITQTRVSRLEPELSNPSASAITQTGATLSVEATTYGLAYPIGFAYGPGLAQSTTAQPAATGQGNTVSFSQSISGLSAGTEYDFRPFAQAGTPAPLVLGPTASFTSGPPDPPPTCVDVSATTTQGTAQQVSLQCTGAGTLTYEVVAGPTGGELSGLDAGAGTVTYTPGPGFSGHDSFTYRATNAGGPSATARAQITVEPSSGPVTPSNEFTLGKQKRDKRHGTTTIAVTVAAPGTLQLAKSKKVKGASVNVARDHQAELLVRPSAKTKRLLHRHGSAKLTISVTFTPDGGSANTKSATVRLRLHRSAP